MTEQRSKRDLPGPLKTLLEADIRISKNCFDYFDHKYGVLTYHHILKYLEYSCHGLIWLFGTFAGVYLFPAGLEFFINLLILLVLDIVVVAVIKAYTRRRRPSYNQGHMFVTVSVDKFSFPSGHATRSVALAFFFGCLYPPIPIVTFPLVAAWAAAVCASRVLLGRHHVLDVAGGFAIGLAEYVVALMLLVGPDTTKFVAENLFGEDPWSSA